MNQEFAKELDVKRTALAELCLQHGVASLDLFGSAIDATWNSASSDLDFLVTFNDMLSGNIADRFLDFAVGLETLFGRAVDLVTPTGIKNPYFRASVQATRTSVYRAA